MNDIYMCVYIYTHTYIFIYTHTISYDFKKPPQHVTERDFLS